MLYGLGIDIFQWEPYGFTSYFMTLTSSQIRYNSE